MKSFFVIFVLFPLWFAAICCHTFSEQSKPFLGTSTDKTQGEVWPLPQHIQPSTKQLALNPESFVFYYKDKCEMIQAAFYRYYDIIFNPPRSAINKHRNKNRASKSPLKSVNGQLPGLEVFLTGNCEAWPYFDMDEQYTLEIATNEYPLQARLTATTVWGVLRGLETFSQLVYYDKGNDMFLVNGTYIVDFPRFSHRGILIDTSRHFVPLHVIQENLDAMAYNKMNVLHWHIVDDQSFPYQSKKFPAMSEQGAYEPENHIYTPSDIATIVNYARLRGIRVIPEFDTPGHTLSWGAGVPNLLTKCFTEDGEPNGYGPIDPTLNSTYDFLLKFFLEVRGLFPDKYIHLGGDEVAFDCWSSNPNVTNFMTEMNITSYSELEGFYMSKLINIVSGLLGADYIVWQEVVDNGVAVNNATIVEVWKSDCMSEMNNVTLLGLRAILASCWYLDYINYGSDWKSYYSCEPLSFNGTSKQNQLVIGGEACLWGEFVDATNLISRMWPRASAAAERLWSSELVTNVTTAEPRLEAHRCRLMTRGINAEPQNGPGFCDSDYLV